MIQTIGVKPSHSSILELKKELLYFDKIYFFGDSAAWSLAEILIPENTRLDSISAIKNAFDEVEKLVQTGKTENKLLKQIFTEYSSLREMGIVVACSESDILTPFLNHREKLEDVTKPSGPNSDEVIKMGSLLVFLQDQLKAYNKSKPKQLKKIRKETPLNEIPLEDLFDTTGQSYIENEVVIRELYGEINARLFSYLINRDDSSMSIPILNRLSSWKNNDIETEKTLTNKVKIVNAVFNSLPMPCATTPLSEVLDFKKDSEANGHILALNNWIIDMSTKNLSVLELEQKIEYLMSEYSRFINLNKLKFEASKFEIAITSIAEVAENLARLKFSSVARSVFQVFKNDLRLLEADMNAPGREVAYISSARKKFQI